MIFIFGRKDLGTGILHNFSDGGEGACGVKRSEETRRKIAKSKVGEGNPMKREDVRRKASRARRGKPNPGQASRMVGRKHWVNEQGEGKFQAECPGEGWRPGKGKKVPGKNS